MKKEGLPYTVVFSFVITFAFVFLLALANQLTIPRVERNRELASIRAVLTAMDLPFATDEEAERLFAAIRSENIQGELFHVHEQDGRRRYATSFAGAGVWGTIRGILAVDESAERLIGLEIIAHNETPGLGGRIDEPAFKAQFRDLALRPDGILISTDGTITADKTAGVVDGLTGATGTTRRLNAVLNNRLAQIKELLGASR